MKEALKNIKSGTKVTPKTLGMTTAKNNFYRWGEQIDELIKNGKHFYKS
ncbi:MAG: hypothetical protein II309_02005 [Bacilli bacterium]|nr:hypothetical protein [Bacilli bacterium]